MLPGRPYRVRATASASKEIKAKIAKLGTSPTCGKWVENSKLYPNQGPCVLMVADENGEHGSRPSGAGEYGGRFRGWLPLKHLTWELASDEDFQVSDELADAAQKVADRFCDTAEQVCTLLSRLRANLGGDLTAWAKKNKLDPEAVDAAASRGLRLRQGEKPGTALKGVTLLKS